MPTIEHLSQTCLRHNIRSKSNQDVQGSNPSGGIKINKLARTEQTIDVKKKKMSEAEKLPRSKSHVWTGPEKASNRKTPTGVLRSNFSSILDVSRARARCVLCIIGIIKRTQKIDAAAAAKSFRKWQNGNSSFFAQNVVNFLCTLYVFRFYLGRYVGS